MKYKISIEIVDTGESFAAIRDGIENTLEAARKFMWRNLEKRPTTGAVDLGWECGICKSSNLQSDLVCGFCDSPRPSH